MQALSIVTEQKLSPARAALATHLATVEASGREMQGITNALAVLREPRRRAEATRARIAARASEQVAAISLDEIIKDPSANIPAPMLDADAELEAREYEHEVAAFAPRIAEAEARLQDASARHAALATHTARLVGAIIVEDSRTVAAEYERRLAAARETAAQLEGARALLATLANRHNAEGRPDMARSLFQNMGDVPRADGVAWPTVAEVSAATPAWADLFAALGADPEATL